MKIAEYIKLGKNSAKTILKVFLLFMLIFTFFSKSFLSWTLPRVTAERVDSGSLLKVMRSEGEVLPKRKIEFYSDISTRIISIDIEKYDEVNTGELLIVLDKVPIEKNIENLRLELAKLELSLKRMKLSRENSLLGLKSESINRLFREMEKSKKTFDNQMILYDIGSSTEIELVQTEENYISAKENYEKQIEINLIDDQVRRNEILSVETQIEEYNLTITSINEEILLLEDDIESCEVRATEPGIIEDIPYSEGLMVNSATPLYILSSIEDGFEVHSNFPSETTKFISIGDKFSVTIKELGEVVNGYVIEKRKSDFSGIETLVLDIDHSGLRGGEICDLFIRKQYGDYDTRVPRSAIYSTTEIENVFLLIEHDTAFGKSYTVKLQEVLLGESDDVNVGVDNGLFGNDKVIVTSTRDLRDGDKVILND